MKLDTERGVTIFYRGMHVYLVTSKKSYVYMYVYFKKTGRNEDIVNSVLIKKYKSTLVQWVEG